MADFGKNMRISKVKLDRLFRERSEIKNSILDKAEAEAKLKRKFSADDLTAAIEEFCAKKEGGV